MTHIKDIYEMDEEWEADRRAGNLEGARSTYTGTYIPISSLVNMLAQKIGHHSADKIADLLYHSRDFTPAGFHIDRTHPRDPSPATSDEPATAEELGLSVPPGFQPQSRFQSGPSLRRPLNPPRTSGSGRNSLGLTINSTAEQSGSAYRSIAMRASLVPSAATRARSPSPAVKAESPTTPTPAPRRKRRASEIGEGSGSSSSSGTAPQTPPRTSPVKTESLDDAVKTESTHDAPVKTEPADAEAPVKAEPADADEPAPKPKRARKSRTTATPELRVLPDRVGRGRRRMPADELFY
ncbi:hypothetical protein Q8F55_008083 [Vanrija albida]|uniref:Uncharacterized protein n=1 Tax=Vanrija albida TaxID=181172 RepID=A0ABR3PVD9_9TREE